MANRPRPSDAVLKRESAKIRKAAAKRERTAQAARDADQEFRDVINAAFENGLSASYIEEEAGLTRSRLYQIQRGSRI
ncbi:hypothetical protein [Mycolicibacterium sphagni]|uniref:hypothetical protein n=1 Tax=Mycolicibacterium sphagni TaxID=1786 RepID=UPI0021F39AD0|nr:hypothetical protein [Mycolicibacterium sphagni]MCV7174955.1 hypothetical protein [Mycolicibacterium sphagni]